jgi:hypothetical protein
VAFPVEAMLRICYSPGEDGWGRYSWEHAAPRSSLPTRRTSPREGREDCEARLLEMEP